MVVPKNDHHERLVKSTWIFRCTIHTNEKEMTGGSSLVDICLADVTTVCGWRVRCEA